MSAPLLLGIGSVGGAGALARIVLDGAITARTRHGRRWPLGILAVNLSGALLLGVVVGAAVHGDRYRLLATGLLGSYTTFSTWMFDSHRLARDGRGGAAVLNLAASLVLGLLAVWLGRELGQAL
jgi:CrcB protein